MTDQDPHADPALDVTYPRREFLGRAGKLVAAAAVAAPFAGVARAASRRSLAEELEVWYLTGNPEEIKYLTAATKSYGSKNGLDTTFTPYDYDPIRRAMKLALSSKRGPDIAYGNPSPDDQGTYQKNGWIIDLEPYAKKYGWKNRFNADVMDYWNNLCCGGSKPRTGIPFDLVTVGWFYNPKIFAKYGVKPPTTFAQFEAMMAKLKARGVVPFAAGGLNLANPGALHYVFEQLVHGLVPRNTLLGFQLLSPKVSWTHPGIVRALTISQDWVKKGYLEDNALATSGTDADAMFVNGDAAMTVNGTWKNSQFLTTKAFKPRFFGTPAVNPRLPWVMGGYSPNNTWMISSYANDKDAAAAYLDYMLGEEVAMVLWNHSDAPAYRFKKTPAPKSQLQADVYKAMGKAKTGFYLSAFGGYFGTQYRATIEKAFSLSNSPKEVAEELQENYKRTLDAA